MSVGIMREPGAVSVQRAVAHILRRGAKGGLVISDAEVSLRDQEAFRQFLEAHVKKSLEDGDARMARFKPTAPEKSVSDGATRALSDGAKPSALLTASADTARSLHRIIESQRTTSECTFVYATYSVESGPHVPCLALLKLDPADAFRAHKVARQNRTVVEMEELNDVLPSQRERLQKAALIRRSGRGFELLVVDRQQRGGDEPAEYFMSFLGAQFSLDASEATKRFFVAVHEGVKDARQHLSYDDQDLVSTAVRTALHTERVDPTELIEGLRIPKAAKEIISGKLRLAIEDKAFKPDPKVAEALTKRRIFRGSYGVKLTIDAETASDPSVLRVSQDSGVTVVTLRLEDWEEVRR